MKELLEKKAALVKEIETLRADMAANKNEWNDDRQARFDKVDAEYTNVCRQLEAAARLDKIASDEAAQAAQRNADQGGKDTPPELEYRDAYRQYLLFGNAIPQDVRKILQAGEKRGTSTQIIATDSLGGYLVPTEFDANIEKAMKYYGPVMQAATLITTPNGRDIELPTVDDTATSAAIQSSEDSAVAVADVTFGQVIWKAWTYATLIKTSEQLLQDSGVHLSSLFAELIAERLGRKANTELTTGDNSSKPQGVVTGSTLGKTTAATTAFTAAELIDFIHSVDIAYRTNPKSAWMMHDSIAGAVRKLAVGTSDARFLWESSMQLGQPDRLLGFPVWINNDMDSAVTAAKKIALFGDFSKYRVRRVSGFVSKRLDELYAASLSVGFITAMRLDGRYAISGAVKHLITAAS